MEPAIAGSGSQGTVTLKVAVLSPCDDGEGVLPANESRRPRAHQEHHAGKSWSGRPHLPRWRRAPERLFDVNVRVTAQNTRGVLARLAAEVSEADSNIDHIETEQRSSQAYTTIVFTIQVKNRMHLAQVLRRLRRIPEVVRIQRLKKKT